MKKKEDVLVSRYNTMLLSPGSVRWLGGGEAVSTPAQGSSAPATLPTQKVGEPDWDFGLSCIRISSFFLPIDLSFAALGSGSVSPGNCQSVAMNR